LFLVHLINKLQNNPVKYNIKDMDSLLQRIKINSELVEKENYDKSYDDVETMYVEELLKSDFFDFLALNEHVDNKKGYTVVYPNSTEIRYQIATFYRDYYKNRKLHDVIDKLKAHFANNNSALSHMSTLINALPSEILARVLNRRYQDREISFESEFSHSDWGYGDYSKCNLILCRRIKSDSVVLYSI